MKCTDCKFSEQAPLDPNNIGMVRPLICRRFPPAAQMVQTGPQQAALIANFPMMTPDSWCWEFSPNRPGYAAE